MTHDLTFHGIAGVRQDDRGIEISTAFRVTSGPPITARLARGADHLGHFELEGGPYPALSAEALAAHLRALAPHAATAYATI